MTAVTKPNTFRPPKFGRPDDSDCTERGVPHDRMLSFGLGSIPVELVTAVEHHGIPRCEAYAEATGWVQRRRVCTGCSRDVPVALSTCADSPALAPALSAGVPDPFCPCPPEAKPRSAEASGPFATAP
ncbi:hypothetical protein GCM10009753_65820 [Streptantibioticus ferralitis]